jgi:hypothetical protein
MSDKFDMKVVIDTVTTPLLHSKLSSARSYRERAAILRSLAESALRGDPGATRTAVDAATSLPTQPPSLVPGTREPGGHDIVALVDQFAEFLGADA